MDAIHHHDIDLDTHLGDQTDAPLDRVNGITRRQLLRFCAGVAATMGLSTAAGLRMAEAAVSLARPPVIWLHGIVAACHSPDSRDPAPGHDFPGLP